MPRKTKFRTSRVANGTKGGRNAKRNASDSESDQNDEPPTKRNREFTSGTLGFLMTGAILQNIINETSTCSCAKPVYNVDILSYSGFNANLGFFCQCGKQKNVWSGPPEINESILMACKYNGIQNGQIGGFLNI